MKSLWLLDLDGTLVDTSGDIVRAARAVLRDLGRPPMDPAEIMSHVGLGTPLLIAGILGLEPDRTEVAAATERFVGVYDSAPVSLARTYPGTEETLEVLARTARIAIVSNKDERLVRSTIEGLGLDRWVARAWGATDPARTKPAPYMLEAAMREMGVPASGTTMTGDMAVDIAAGRAAGVRTLFAEWGYGILGDDDPVPDGRLRRLEEILEWIG